MTEEQSPANDLSPATLERMARSVLEAGESRIRTDGANLSENGQMEADTLAEVLLSEKYSGIFPHPSVLRGLGQVVEHGAERAFRLTEKEQDHRHDCDRKLVDAE